MCFAAKQQTMASHSPDSLQASAAPYGLTDADLADWNAEGRWRPYMDVGADLSAWAQQHSRGIYGGTPSFTQAKGLAAPFIQLAGQAAKQQAAPPNAPPDVTDKANAEAANAQRLLAQTKRGLSSTFLTGPMMDAPAPTPGVPVLADTGFGRPQGRFTLPKGRTLLGGG
jgi:hypothetical protein